MQSPTGHDPVPSLASNPALLLGIETEVVVEDEILHCFCDSMPLLTSTTSFLMEGGSPLEAFYDLLEQQWENSRSCPSHRARSRIDVKT